MEKEEEGEEEALFTKKNLLEKIEIETQPNDLQNYKSSHRALEDYTIHLEQQEGWKWIDGWMERDHSE